MTEHQAHDPVDLLDELDAVVREHELLRLRMAALQARYQALQVQADAGQFDKLNASGAVEVYGSIEVQYTARWIGHAVNAAKSTTRELQAARELAVNVREYPQTSEAAERGGKWFEAGQEWSR